MEWLWNLGQIQLVSLGTMLGLALIFLVLTKFTPCNPGQNWWKDRRAALTDFVYWLVVPFITQAGRVLLLIVGVWLFYGEKPEAKAWFQHWPIWMQCGAILLIQDILLYWLHRLFHTRAGWLFHAIHHSPETLDWTSTQRFHPVNAVLEFAVADAVVLLLGFSPSAVAILGPINLAYSVMVHANLNWTFGPLRYLLVSPVYHRWHHTSAEEGRDRNFASTFPFLDLLFGTYYMPEGEVPVEYGASGVEVPKTFIGQFAFPFRPALDRLARRPKLAMACGVVAVLGTLFSIGWMMKPVEDSSPPGETEALKEPELLPKLPMEDRRPNSALAVLSPNLRSVCGSAEGFVHFQEADGKRIVLEDRHRGRVNAIAVVPDGSLFITASADGTVKVWRGSGKLLRTLSGHGTSVLSVAILADGSCLTGAADGLIRLWNPKGELVSKLKASELPIHAVAMTENSESIAFAHGSDAAIWMPKENRTVPLKDLKELAYCLRFAGENILLSGGYEGRIQQWDTATGQCLKTWIGHRGPVYTLRLDRNGFQSGGADGILRSWEYEKSEPTREGDYRPGMIFEIGSETREGSLVPFDKAGLLPQADSDVQQAGFPAKP